MTTSIKDFNCGGYLQVGGTSVTLTVGSDGLTLGVGGQLSVGYTVSGTTNINYSVSGGWEIQPSVMQGLGTPTGTRYGTIDGEVTWISADALTRDSQNMTAATNPASNGQAPLANFPAHIRLNKQTISVEGKTMPVTPGFSSLTSRLGRCITGYPSEFAPMR